MCTHTHACTPMRAHTYPCMNTQRHTTPPTWSTALLSASSSLCSTSFPPSAGPPPCTPRPPPLSKLCAAPAPLPWAATCTVLPWTPLCMSPPWPWWPAHCQVPSGDLWQRLTCDALAAPPGPWVSLLPTLALTYCPCPTGPSNSAVIAWGLVSRAGAECLARKEPASTLLMGCTYGQKSHRHPSSLRAPWPLSRGRRLSSRLRRTWKHSGLLPHVPNHLFSVFSISGTERITTRGLELYCVFPSFPKHGVPATWVVLLSR